MNTTQWKNRARSRGTGGARTVLVVVLVGLTLGVMGGAHAAGLITGKQIKDGSVTGQDVRNGTITTTDVVDGSLTLDDYAGLVTAPPGAQGERGQNGADGLEHLGVDRASDKVVQPGQIETVVATCLPGEVAVGGGLYAPPGRRLQLLDSAPLGTDNVRRASWVGRAYNDTTIDARITAFALCAEVQP